MTNDDIDGRAPAWALDPSVLLRDGTDIVSPTIDFARQPHPGKIIVFEGVDGTGKSTSLRNAADYLEERGIPVEVLDLLSPNCRQLPYFRAYADDSTTAIRGEVDQPSLGMVCLADRLMRFRTHFYKKLREGTWLLCDRYVFTPIADTLALGADKADVDMLVSLASRFPKPDLGFAPTVSPELAIERIRQRPKDRGKVLDPGFYRRAITSFRTLLAHHEFIELDSDSGFDAVLATMSEHLDPMVEAYLADRDRIFDPRPADVTE